MGQCTNALSGAMETAHQDSDIDGWGDEGAGYDYAHMVREFMGSEPFRAWLAAHDAQVRAEAERTLPSEEELARGVCPCGGRRWLQNTHESQECAWALQLCQAVLARLSTAPTVEQVRQGVAKALREQRTVCPVHGIPDCSALLNGCMRPSLIGNTVEGCARIAEQGGAS